MVSDLDLVTRLREILRISDLDTATPASVRRQLEEDFSVDLTDKKGFIRDQIDAILKSNAGIEDIPESPRTEERIAMDGIVRIAIEGAVGRHPVVMISRPSISLQKCEWIEGERLILIYYCTLLASVHLREERLHMDASCSN